MKTNEVCMLLFSQEKTVRAEAAKTLGERGEEGGRAVLPLLRAEDWVLRYRAAEVIGLCGHKEFSGFLLPLLADERDHVRYMAVKSLGKIGNSFHADAVKSLADDKNPFVVWEVFRTLALWRGERRTSL